MKKPAKSLWEHISYPVRHSQYAAPRMEGRSRSPEGGLMQKATAYLHRLLRGEELPSGPPQV